MWHGARNDQLCQVLLIKKKNSEDWELLIELKNVEIIDDLVIDIYVLSHFSRV